MPRRNYHTIVKNRKTCAKERGLDGCHTCNQNIWNEQPCELSYDLATHDIENVESRIQEIHKHYEAVRYLEATYEPTLQEALEAGLNKHHGYSLTLAEFVHNAETYVKLLKERVAACDQAEKQDTSLG